MLLNETLVSFEGFASKAKSDWEERMRSTAYAVTRRNRVKALLSEKDGIPVGLWPHFLASLNREPLALFLSLQEVPPAVE